MLQLARMKITVILCFLLLDYSSANNINDTQCAIDIDFMDIKDIFNNSCIDSMNCSQQEMQILCNNLSSIIDPSTVTITITITASATINCTSSSEDTSLGSVATIGLSSSVTTVWTSCLESSSNMIQLTTNLQTREIITYSVLLSASAISIGVGIAVCFTCFLRMKKRNKVFTPGNIYS